MTTMSAFVVQTSVLAVLLVFSAFFSGSETAFFSLNSLEKDVLRRRAHGSGSKFVSLLFHQPDEVLVTVLTGNMFVNIFASSIAEALGTELFQEAAELVSIAAMTLLLLIIGEMTPKSLAIRHSLRFATFSAPILQGLYVGLKPVAYPLGLLRHAVLSAVPRRGGDVRADQASAVLSAIRMGYQSKTIDESELRLLERFFRFRQKTAADVMTPRVDLEPNDASTPVASFLKSSLASGGVEQSLIPVYRQDVDHISGYVRRADLIRQRLHPTDQRLADIAHPIHAVPASKDLREVMDEMSERGTELAVVVDEYGGTEGILSFPRLIDYLFEDFLPAADRLIESREGAFRIAGAADVNDVAAMLGIELESSSRTIAGLILDVLGEFPEVGRHVELEGYRFVVSELDEHRISWLEAEKSGE